MIKTPLLMFLLAPMSLAQSGEGGLVLDPQYFEYPSGATYGGTADFTRLSLGNFYDTREIGCVYFKGGCPVFGITPGHSVSFVRASIDPVTDVLANDIATLEGGGLSGRDGLLSTGQDGLLVTFWDELTEDFISTTIGSGPDWNDGLLVRSGDIDGDGDQDIVTVASDGVTVRGMEWDQSSGTWIPGLVFTSAFPIREIELMRWQHAPAVGLDIALFTSWGFLMHDAIPGAPLLASLRTSSNSGHANGGHSLTVLEEVGYDRLASCFNNKHDTFQYLVVQNGTSGGGHQIDPTIVLAGQFGVGSANSADHDGDGDWDLFLVKSDDGEAIVLENDGTPFDLATSFIIDLPSMTNTSEIGLADFDLDGVVDGVIPGPEAGTGGTVLFDINLGQDLPQAQFSDRQTFPCGVEWHCDVAGDTIEFDVLYTDLLVDYDGFFIECWQRPVTNPQTSRTQVFTALANATGSPTTERWRITLDVVQLMSDRTYYFLVRPRNSTTDALGPRVILALSDDEDDLNGEHHNTSTGWGSAIPVDGIGCPTTGLTSQWVIGTTNIPPYDVGTPRVLSEDPPVAAWANASTQSCGAQ